MLPRSFAHALLTLSLAGGLVACNPADFPIDVEVLTPTPVASVTPTTFGSLVYVDTIDLVTLESFPVQITAIVRGHLPDGCTSLVETKQSRVEAQFTLTFVTTRPSDVECPQVLVPFETKVALEVGDLPAGVYQVVAAGVTNSFTFAQDNMLPIDGGKEPLPMKLAYIESVAATLDTARQPTQVTLDVTGYFPDGCTSLDKTIITQLGSAFAVQLTTKRPPEMMCTEALVPFETTVTLDVTGLKAGDYQVAVNDTVTTTFTLAADN